MLLNLYVKNIALIHEVEMDFTKGFNVLTGETGAGKSLIVDSVSFALGGRVSKDIVREDAEYALCELTFTVDSKELGEKLEELGVYLEDDQVVLTRRISGGRGSAKINGETVSAGVLREVSSLLLDLHGQHEHQSLLNKSRHLEILDEYCGTEIRTLLSELSGLVKEYRESLKELSEGKEKLPNLEREKEFLKFEIDEIEAAKLTEGEDEELERRFLRMRNARRILEAVGAAYAECGYESENAAGSVIGRALSKLKPVEELDETIGSLILMLTDIDSLMNDFNRSAAEYEQSLEFSEEEFAQTEERLNTLNHLKNKYGNTITNVIKNLEEKQTLLLKYTDFEAYLRELESRCETTKEKALKLAGQISKLRKKGAKELEKKIAQSLMELNFLDARFEITVIGDEERLSVKGMDEVEFMISTNPGEKLRPLTEVASGGELSRIMLALKTVLADKDQIETLIFDEIDTGISGRTAQKVSEKLAFLSGKTQVICITHLPQIAAMADSHYEIQKQVRENHTETTVRRLSEEEITGELARMLSGAEVTENVIESAREMKRLAQGVKQGYRLEN
ncbi:MAG: DNA repair protein RecN [Lachnospiraceae bacterium]|nr:DNA repair protein RecN [Lachnospiraceae bacterium]